MIERLHPWPVTLNCRFLNFCPEDKAFLFCLGDIEHAAVEVKPVTDLQLNVAYITTDNYYGLGQVTIDPWLIKY